MRPFIGYARLLPWIVLTILLLSTVIVHAAQDAQPIALGETLTGALTTDVNSFNYDLAAADTPVLLTATAETFLPTLGLAYTNTQGGGFSVSFDGDVGNPVFIPPLVDGNSVQVQVTSNSFPAEGDFTLTAAPVDTTPIGVGESVAGELGADGAPQYFSFEAELGKLLTVTAQGGAFDTRLQWFAPGSVRSTAGDNDGGVGYDPEIYQAVITGSGTSYIEVAPAFADEGGRFTLSLALSEPPVLDEVTPTVIRLGGSRGTGVLMFQGMAGGTAQVTIRGVGGDTEGATIAVYQDGVRLVWDDRFQAGEAGSLYQLNTPTDNPAYLIITADTTFDEPDAGQFEVILAGL